MGRLSLVQIDLHLKSTWNGTQNPLYFHNGQHRLIRKMCLASFLWNSINIPMYTNHCSFQLNTSDSKTSTSFIPFHTKYDYMSRFSISKDLFLHDSLHSQEFWCFNHITNNQLHIYIWSWLLVMWLKVYVWETLIYIYQCFPHIDFTWAGRPGILTAAQVYLVTHFCFYYYYYTIFSNFQTLLAAFFPQQVHTDKPSDFFEINLAIVQLEDVSSAVLRALALTLPVQRRLSLRLFCAVSGSEAAHSVGRNAAKSLTCNLVNM